MGDKDGDQAMVTETQEFTLEVLINDDGQTYIGFEEYRTFEDTYVLESEYRHSQLQIQY